MLKKIATPCGSNTKEGKGRGLQDRASPRLTAIFSDKTVFRGFAQCAPTGPKPL